MRKLWKNFVLALTFSIGSLLYSSCENKDTHPEVEYAVDLGLSVKWATCNVGAEKPEDYGDYFAWGETKGYDKDFEHMFSWSNYKWCEGSERSITKYCATSEYGKVDNKYILDSMDDAAFVNWGGSWRMPTRDEMEELIEKCVWMETIKNGIKGYTITSKYNGNSIFLPAAGGRAADTLGEGGCCSYWASTSSDYSPYADCMDDAYEVSTGGVNRSNGFTIRAVCPYELENQQKR